MVINLQMKIRCLKHGYEPKNENKLLIHGYRPKNEDKLFKSW